MLPMNEVTRILSAVDQGGPHAAERLLPLDYDELQKVAAQMLAQEKPGQTRQAMALVPTVDRHLGDRDSGGPFSAASAR
jgi:hypothetical protein